MNWQKALAVVGVGLVPFGFALTSVKYYSYSYTPPPPDRHIEGVHRNWNTGNPDTTLLLPPCEVTPDKGERVVNNGTSFALMVTVKPITALACHADVSISAPAFDVEPDSQTFDLPDKQGNQSKAFTFLLVPKQPGTQLVTVNSQARQDMLYYQVKPSEFVPAWMNPFIGPVLSLFGPILTIPWWIDRREKKKKEKEDEERKAEAEEAKRRTTRRFKYQR